MPECHHVKDMKQFVCLQLPPVTRAYITLSFLTTAGCALDVSSSAVATRLGNLWHKASLSADHIAVQHILQCKAHLSERRSMALADNLYVFWEPRLVEMQSGSQCTAKLCSAVFPLCGDAAGLDFVFHMFFLIKYSKSLEEGSFRGRSADFLWMLLIGQTSLAPAHWTNTQRIYAARPAFGHRPATMLTAVLWLCRRSSAHLLCPLRQHTVSWVVTHLHDGKQAPSHGSIQRQRHQGADNEWYGVQVYVWARRHQYVTLSFLGIFTFTAPYLPWVLLAFSVVLRSSPVVDLMGMLAGIPPSPCAIMCTA